jgi:hypothetical protein
MSVDGRDVIENDDKAYSDYALTHEEEPRRRVYARRHVVGPVLVARIATALLWLLIVGAVALGVVAAVTRIPQPEPAPADVVGSDGTVATVAGHDAVLVAGFAQMAVRRYVGLAGEGAEDVMEGLVADDVAGRLAGVTSQGFSVVDAVTVDVDDLGDGQWSAMVACDLMAALDGTYEPVGVRYYRVGVATGEGGGAVVLTDLPSMVPPPEMVEVGEPLADLGSPRSDDPQVTAVREFLGALLLGESSVQRDTAPGTGMAAITPPPFVALELDGFGVADPDAEETPARVSVLAIDAHGLAQRLHYTVNLRVREGRWEVTELLGAPPINDVDNVGTGRARDDAQ